MNRMRLWVVGMLIVALVIGACAPPPSQPPPVEAPAAEAPAVEEAAPTEPTPTATPIVAEAGAGATRLIYWNGLTGSDGVTMVEMVQKFTEENPDVSVRVEMMPWGTYFDKLLTSLVSGSPPDLFLLHEFEIPQFAGQGVLADMSDYYDDHGGPVPVSDIYPRVLEALELDGARYGVPLDIHGWGLWYNKDLFVEAGLDPETCPATAEEFVAAAKKLTKDVNGKRADEEGFDPTQVEQWGTAVSWQKPTTLSTMWQFGGDWSDRAGNATLTSDAVKKAVQFWYDLIYVEHVAPPPAGFDTWQTMAAGKLGMLPEGSWFLNFANDNEINWGVCPFPKIGDEHVTWISSHVIYTPPTLAGEKLEAAKRLISFLTEQGALWATSGQPPARISQFESLTPDRYLSAIVLGTSFQEIGRYDFAHPCIQQVIDQGYMPEFDAIYNNLKTVEQGLADANARVQDILDRCR
ncbi:MAG: ABC transporter substrate-binding protein [Caldilinea sp.]|nr:ABC transporter substrate-binding protein [Caldilinea sp.]MDW8440877.1 ABC transporter substrate-binding protein [Caldilineaceae bacterium]